MTYDPTTDGGKAVLASALSSALQRFKGKLSKVALSNSYNDLDDKLKAGENITIADDGTISAEGGGSTYTAGDGITIENGVINAPYPDFAKLFKDMPLAWDATATYAKDAYVYGSIPSDDGVVVHDLFVYRSLHDDNTGNMPVLTGSDEHWKLVGQLPMFYQASNLPDMSVEENALPLLCPDIQEDADGNKSFGSTTRTVFIEKDHGFEIDVKNSRLYMMKATGNKLGGVMVGDNINQDSDGKISVPRATASSLGVTWPGDGLDIDSHDAMTLRPATATSIGGVKAGDGLSIADDGTLSATSYSLPTASATTLGGVKVGSNLTVASDGTLSAASGLPECSAADAGKFLTVDSTGAPVWTSVPNAEEASF